MSEQPMKPMKPKKSIANPLSMVSMHLLFYALLGFQLAQIVPYVTIFDRSTLFVALGVWLICVVHLPFRATKHVARMTFALSCILLLLVQYMLVAYPVHTQALALPVLICAVLGATGVLSGLVDQACNLAQRPLSILFMALLPLLVFCFGSVVTASFSQVVSFGLLLAPVMLLLAMPQTEVASQSKTAKASSPLYWFNMLWFWTSVLGYLSAHLGTLPIFFIGCFIVGFAIALRFVERRDLHAWQTNSTFYWLFLQAALFVHSGAFPVHDLLRGGLLMGLYGLFSAKILLPSLSRLYITNSSRYTSYHLASFFFGLALYPLALLYPRLTMLPLLALLILNTYITDTCSNFLATAAAIFQFFLHRIGVRYSGTERLTYQKNERVIMIANHSSFLDVPILASCFNEILAYPIYPFWLNNWAIRVLGGLVADMYAMKPGQSSSLAKVIHAIRQGQKCLIFPEGRLTDSGNLMKLFDGTVILAEHTQANIQPVIINGGMNHILSRDDGRHKKRLFTPVQVRFGEARPLPETHLRGRAKRKFIKRHLFKRLTETYLESYPSRTLPLALYDASRRYGSTRIILQNSDFLLDLSYQSLIQRAKLMAVRLKRVLAPGQRLGVTVYSGADCAVLYVACLIAEIVIVPISSEISSDDLQTLYAHIGIDAVVIDTNHWQSPSHSSHFDVSAQNNIRLIDFDELKQPIRLGERFSVARQSLATSSTPPHLIPAWSYFDHESHHITVLSHDNLCRQAHQLHIYSDLNGSDVVFNAVGLQSTYGLLMGLLNPLLSGIKTVLSAQAVDNKHLIQSFYDTQATVLIHQAGSMATDMPHSDVAYEVMRMRAIFCDGMPSADVRDHWEKSCMAYVFGVFCDPAHAGIIAMHSPYAFSASSLGRLLPGNDLLKAEDGESCLRGPIAPDLYYQNKHDKIISHPQSVDYKVAIRFSEDCDGFLQFD